jgi:glycyl-tRNA synthetase beta chain
MGELLLELLSEEIPARMQRRAIDDLVRHLNEWLKAQRIEPESIAGYVTPRRLTVIASGIPETVRVDQEEKRGPRVGSPQQAIEGFLRSVGLNSISQCEKRTTDRGEFYFAVLMHGGQATIDVLPDLIYSTLHDVEWPKSMRYPASALRWVRPINSAICLFDGEVLKLPQLGAVPVGRVTRGHRFLSKGEISVVNAADYLKKLTKAYVVLDWGKRRDFIDSELTRIAKEAGLTVKPDEGLLDEVAGLVEYPVVLMGSIDANFVRPLPDGLPPEVLATAMRTHQKYFSCLNPDGTPTPSFLFVANNETADNGAAIVAGNERVLRARLSDAKFFWDQDRKVRLEDRVEALKQRVYHEKLGSVYDKVERMEKLAEYFAKEIYSDPLLARRAARLAKADLSTGMVGEFPELQGLMGFYYALSDGEDQRVADAIADHYKPLGPRDNSATAPLSASIALADKCDSIAAFFSANERPTGSGDPFALRRAAQGIIRTILEGDFRISLAQAFTHALFLLARETTVADEEVVRSEELVAFVLNRLEVHLREQGVRADLVRAARGQIVADGADLLRFRARVEALENFIKTSDGSNMLIAYRRASNIVSIEEKRGNVTYDEFPDPDGFREPAETHLDHALGVVGGFVGGLLREGDFEQAMSAMSALRQPIDEFFERVTVNAPEKELRENRLRLLARIRSTMNQIADFSQIEG